MKSMFRWFGADSSLWDWFDHGLVPFINRMTVVMAVALAFAVLYVNLPEIRPLLFLGLAVFILSLFARRVRG